MTDENESGASTPQARVVGASRYQNGVLVGKIEILASTKHGATSMMSVRPSTELEPGDTLVADAWILGARNFIVVGRHLREMKIPGTWYEVRGTQTQKPTKKK